MAARTNARITDMSDLVLMLFLLALNLYRLLYPLTGMGCRRDAGTAPSQWQA
jgi:hypothetical protein